MAAADYIPLVQSLYVSYFGRPADTFGLANFTAQLEALKAPTTLPELNIAVQTAGPLKNLVNSFSGSAESAALYGTGDTVAFVSAIYANLLNRSPDFDGLVFWVNAINTGALTRANASLAIASGASSNTSVQGVADAALIANKVGVATAFTTEIDTGVELAAYSGAGATAAGRALLAGVTSTTTVASYQPNVVASLATLVDTANPGQTYTLGVISDSLVGTAGKDVFNAYNLNPQNGDNATTLSTFDNVDGGAGKDTLNVYTKSGFNVNQVGTVNNVEVINIYNEGTLAADQFGAAAGVNAGKFVGASEVWQIGFANDVNGLGSLQTAGFRNITNDVLTVAASNASATIALDNVSGITATNILDVNVSGDSLSSVTLTGTLVKADAAVSAAAAATLDITAGKDVTTVTVNTAVDATVTATEAAGFTKAINTLNATGSSGKVTFVGDAATVAINGGSGADKLTIATATLVASTGVTAVSAAVSGGAGNDTITLNTTGTGTTTVDGGAGDDSLVITGRSSGVLNVQLGEGADKLTSAVAIQSTDVINAGGGIDTLLLSLVGSSNIGAFAGFDVFDLTALGTKTLDVDILTSKNTVTEFVSSGSVAGTATLTNVGANVGFRATADQDTSAVILTQKTPGALTVTVDADETGDADTTIDVASANVTATNATSVKAVFDTNYTASIAAETTVGDNATTLTLAGGEIKTLEVTSGGTLSANTLALGTIAKLESITITGASALSITGSSVKLANVDGSAATGGLTISTAALADKGTIKLGTGADIVTVDATSIPAGGSFESVSGFEKTSAVAVGADATAAAAAQVGTDILKFAVGANIAADVAANATHKIDNGVFSFVGAGPTDLASAVTAIQAVTAANEVVVFEYIGSTYAVSDAGALVKLVGVTGVTDFAEVAATDSFFIV